MVPTERSHHDISGSLCTSVPIISHRTQREYRLTPASMVDADSMALAEIVRICNEPGVYDNLFAGPLSNRAYALDDAQRFISWSYDGWREGTHFVYFIVDTNGSVVGAIDIKSTNLASAEIGYWLSAEHSGAMTSAVVALASLAREAGFAELHALIRPDNQRSSAVVERAGFVYTNDIIRDGQVYRRYARRLATPGS